MRKKVVKISGVIGTSKNEREEGEKIRKEKGLKVPILLFYSVLYYSVLFYSVLFYSVLYDTSS